MQPKSLWLGVVALVCAILLPSCGSKVLGPEIYKVEIEDAFRAQVATGVIFMIYGEEHGTVLADRMDNAANAIEAEAAEDADLAKFKLALEQLAPEDELAANCLTLYNLIEPEFSAWAKLQDQDGRSFWVATELNSHVIVTFSNNKDLEWDVDLDVDTFADFVHSITDSILEDEEE